MAKHFVAMTPLKFESMKTIRFERTDSVDQSLVHHVAGGQHSGIIVCKEQIGDTAKVGTPETQLEFVCVMIDNNTLHRHKEKRRLKFWFMKNTDQNVRLTDSYNFIRELIEAETFPKDYAGFIKKIMKQLHGHGYLQLKRIDLDLVPLEASEQVGFTPDVERPTEDVLRETLQMRLEEAYPNVLSMEDLVRILEVKDSHYLDVQMLELINRDLVEAIPLQGEYAGRVGYRRKIHLQNQEVMELESANHMQQVSTTEKPTIAIITNLLCEKLAVDAMIDQKTTFVRYKTEGESNVYTIGNIGNHRVISTKLPMVGRELEAKISSASTTTRLLGAFQSVQHVFLVGVAGSVPHVYEFDKHSRLGDIVVGAPVMTPPPGWSQSNGDGPASKETYIYCDKIITPEEPNGDEVGDRSDAQPLEFVLRNYTPQDPFLLRCVNNVLGRFEVDPEHCEWQNILENAIKVIGDDETVDYTRPPADTDKLMLKIYDGLTFDIRHPGLPDELARMYPPGVPAVRLGCIGSGRPITENDKLRDLFAKEHQLLCYDAEYDQVLESVNGNNLESFLILRGIADYVDGRQGTQWQPYAALVAAAFMKAVILDMPKTMGR